ncbi:hypothetical protein SDC9_152478 [bioreactor metagenome]|uniref:NAD-specific glutamate dehydrogenase n=1 Tax=bioreactor metagenome TaxID=1076179 RepID=A0A645ET66_9ZZZZ
MLNGVELIALHADVDLIQAQCAHENAGAFDDLFTLLQHESVVGGYVGLALGSVENDGVRFAHGRAQLHVGGEAGAAHAGDSAGLDNLNDFFGREAFPACPGFAVGMEGILEVVFDDHRNHLVARGGGTRLYSHNLTRNACMDGGAQPGNFADLLSHGDRVSHVHNGLAGRAQMHVHGDYHLRGCLGERRDRLMLRGLLVLGGVDAAVKFILHSITSALSLSANCDLLNKISFI